MKMESQKQQEHVFFLATENIFIHVNKPYRIKHEMIETRNFIPEALMIHQIQESKRADIDCNSFLKVTRGERLMPGFESETWNIEDELLNRNSLQLEDDGGDKDEDDWDDEDEEWDEEDEDWDEEDEEWDEEDEDWEDEDDLDDDDDDEDWEDEDEEDEE